MKYSKREYNEAIKKMRQNTLGELEIANMILDEECIEQIQKKLDAYNKMDKVLDANYLLVLNNYIDNHFFIIMDKLVYTVYTMEQNNNFLFSIITLRETCKELIKLHSTGIINREQLDNIIKLDNELDKMVPYDKTNLINRGKYMYINNYINNLTGELINNKKIVIE